MMYGQTEGGRRGSACDDNDDDDADDGDLYSTSPAMCTTRSGPAVHINKSGT